MLTRLTMRRLCLLTLFGCLSVAALIAHVAGISSLTNVFNVNDDPVAKIGETEYETLADAVDAANASGNCTITLLKDIDFSLSPYADYKWAGSTYNPLTITASGITIDLNRHTISNMGNTAIVFGHLFAKDGRISNATIKNGTLIAGQTNGVTNSYVLGIAGVDGVTIKNVTTTGGINIYTASKNVVIEDCNVNGTKYYTVCAQCGSEVTIKGSTYTKNTDSSVATKAMFWIDKAGSDDDLKTTENPTGAYAASTITLESGNFTVDTTNGGVFYLNTGVKPIVKGGTFNIDPTEYLAEGYGVANNNGNYTVAPYVAQIGETKYTTLQAAINAASDGQTVTLLRDVDATGTMYSGDTRFNLWVKKGITIDGDNKTLTVKGRGIGVQGASGNIDVTFKDITVKNVGNVNGRCIDTRGNLGSLTLNNATLTTAESSYTGYLQPLTIGGNQATTANVTIMNSSIIVVDDANKGYAITTYNPVNMSISGSTIKGWACLNIKGADNSAGSAGSVITVANNSTLVSANGTPGYSNAYSLIKIEDNNVNVAISGSTINVNGGDNTQSIVSFQKLDQVTNSTNCNVSLGENNTVTLEGDYRFATNVESNSVFAITGGTFNVDPVAYCADGYSSIKVGDVWKVGTVTSSEPQAEAGATDTQATYSVTTVVKDEDNQTIGSAANQTISVTAATDASGDIVASDVKLSSLDMNDVVAKVVEAVGASAENISVQLAIAAEKISTVNDVITFEVHPEAVVSVGNFSPTTTVELTNDDLAANASFTFYLDVASKFTNGNQVKIVHKGNPDETSYAIVANGKVPVTVTHFSQFELSEITPQEGMVAVNLTTGVQYATLQAAIDAAAAQSKTSGEQVTVTLLQNVTDGSGLALYGTAANGSNVKIDFNGFTYTVTTPVGSSGTVNQALHFESGSNVTLYNGTINMTDDATALAAFEMFMQNYGTLVIDQMTIDGTGIAVATYSDPKYQTYPEWYNTEKPQFNYNTAGSSVIRNSIITMTGALGIDDAAALTIEDDAVINVSAIATKGTDERYASATATVTVENGAQFKLTDATGAAAFETLLNTNGQSLGTPVNGVYTVEKAKVAQVGDVKYETLEEALDAAASGATVTLLTDIDYSTIYTVRNARDNGNGHVIDLKDLTLDLNGHTISTINATVTFGGNGATITNGTFSLVPKNTDGSYKDGSYALIIDNEVIDAYSETSKVTVTNVVCNGAINICGATVDLNNVTASTTPTKFYAIWAEQGATVTVNSGTFTDNQSSGKGIIATGTGEEGGATVTVKGGTFTGSNKLVNGGDNNSVIIEDGNFTVNSFGATSALQISGGTYNQAVPEAACAPNFTPVTTPDANGKYTVEVAKVAQIGNTKYETLAAAIAAATDGATIEIIADVTELEDGSELTINKSLTITGATDAQGNPLYTISGKSNATGTNDIFITGSGTVTLSNLKIKGFGNNAATDIKHAPVYVSTNFTGTVNLTKLHISDFNRGGVFLYGGSFNVTDCYIDCANSKSGAFTKGLEIKGSASGTISNTFICNMERSSTAYASAGIEIYGNGDVTINGCSIVSDNGQHESVKPTYGIAIGVVGAYNAENGNLTVANTMTNSTNGALSVGADNYAVELTDCSFDNYMAIWNDGSEVVINSGDYAEDVYADAGTFTIHNGEFTNFAPDTGTTGVIAIDGGTFDVVVPANYCAEGFIPVTTPDANGKYTVEKAKVAEVYNSNGALINQYTSFADAWAVANTNTGSTLKMLEPHDTTSQLEASGTFTLDFNGNTLQYIGTSPLNSGVILVLRGAHLTLADTGDNAGYGGIVSDVMSYYLDPNDPDAITAADIHEWYGDVQYAYSAIALTKNGETSSSNATLTVNGGELYGHYYGITGNGNRHGTEITVNGGRIIGAEGSAIYHPQDGTLTITDGELTGKETAIEIRAGELNISGGSYTALTAPTATNPNGSGTTSVGAAIAVAQHTTKKPITVNITGGTFNGYSAFYESNPENNSSSDIEKISLSITGGTFNTTNEGTVAVYCADVETIGGFIANPASGTGPSFSNVVPADYCANGFAPVTTPDANGKYTVEVAKVAQITVGETTTKYETLADAIAAVPTDGTATTITMIADEATEGNTGVTIAADKKIVLDLNDHTVSNQVNTNNTSWVIMNNGTLTIKDTSEGGNGKLLNALADGVNGGQWSNYNYSTAVINNKGTLNIQSGTIEQTAIGNISYTIDNTGEINITGGTISSSNGAGIRIVCNSMSNTSSVTMTAGTINAKWGIYIQNPSGSVGTNKGTLTMSGGTINATRDGITIDSQSDWTSGLSVTLSDNAAINVAGTNARCLLRLDEEKSLSGISITGGTYNAPANVTYANAVNASLGIISGGTFSQPVPEVFCAEGYIPSTLDTNPVTYSVKSGSYVAQITVGETTTKYETLAEAITASATGDEIVMIANSEENVLYDVTSPNLKNKTITISGAYTLTSTSENFGFYFGDYDSGNRPTTDKLNISDITMVKTGGNYTTLFDGVTADLTNVTINGNGNTALSYANGAVGTLTNVTVTNTGNHSQTWRNTALALQSIGTGPSVVTVKSGSYTSANGYAVYMFSSGGTLNIKGGTFSGALIAQIDNNTYPGNQAIINISGGTFTNCTLTESGGENAQINVSGGYFSVDPTAYLLPGYSVETLTSSATGDDLAAFNAGAIYKVQLSVTADITLDDGEEYPYTNDVTITNSITYTRSFTEERIGKYQPWFVPFDYTIKAADLEQFDFYKINVISNSREVGETESSSDEVWVHIYPLTAGTVLHANKPYIIKAKEGAYVADTPYEFVSQKTGDADLILKGKAMDYVHHLSSGIGDFRFYGTYKGTSYSDINATTGQDYFWYLDKLGQLANGNAAFTYSLPSYRWYFIRIAETNYAPMFGFIVDGSEATGLNGIEFASDEDIEGCYTLNGVKVKTPGKGVYIVRYKNGITKKINIK